MVHNRTRVFLYIIMELLLCLSLFYYTLVITIWQTTRKEPQVFEILLSMCISTCIVIYLIEELTIPVPLKIVFLLIFCANLLLVLCVLFFRVAIFLIR